MGGEEGSEEAILAGCREAFGLCASVDAWCVGCAGYAAVCDEREPDLQMVEGSERFSPERDNVDAAADATPFLPVEIAGIRSAPGLSDGFISPIRAGSDTARFRPITLSDGRGILVEGPTG